MTDPTASTPELTEGDLVELEIGDVAHGGIFVARHPSGRVVFVADALPGERVLARVSEVRKRFARAETVSTLEASPERVDHVWAEAALDRDPDDRAGGAEFGHALPEFGRELKRRVLVDSLARFGGLDAESGLLDELRVAALPGDDESRGTGWRTRLTLHVGDDRRVGPYAARSHRIVDVASLPLAFPELETRALAEIAEGSRSPGRIDFVAPSDSDVRLRRRPDGKPAREPETLYERVHDHDFAVGEDGFWQVHRYAAVTLFDAVRDAINADAFDPEAQHLDLYGGVGLLGAALAEHTGAREVRLESVESAETATAHARANLSEWGGATAVTARVDRYLQQLARDADEATRESVRRGTVVLDPPRAGAKEPVIDALAELAPSQLVYVACDPVALGRDTGLLRERGYELARVRAFDLFPNTHHVEAVATFVRA
ncbi:class I SAM-dependent RNA methyltransferase [Gulosibacter faecalis]|uniref:Class I SAM-dependent RNA methyltransferase n=1 Tax=Gulosibacter faecalis TaxID=272240 RepID=A0ABW5UZR4_9MICO|nr:TRAM domain-containing protein [Gulosibacter faecalis]